MKNTIKMLLLKILGPLLLSKSEVSNIQQIGNYFRILTIKGKSLKKPQWKPGSKIQIQITDKDIRSYTPINWDNNSGSFKTMVVLHDNGPLSKWAKLVKPKSKLTVLGPKASLNINEEKSDYIFFGDDTTFGLISAISNHYPKIKFHNFLETNYHQEVAEVLKELNVNSNNIYSINDHERYANDILNLLNKLPKETQVILSGKQQNIVKVRDFLKLNGIASDKIIIKVYWGWKDDPNGKLSAQN